MTDVAPREELKQSFDRHQLMRRHIDQSLDTMLRLNPVENILKCPIKSLDNGDVGMLITVETI